ncbi:MAG: nickel pincer cofactor biosynthesis protein LarC [Janthinobacterium lividum]
MRHLWIDASAGVAGDMLLGALLDAGASLEVVQRAVDAVVAGSVGVEAHQVTRAGMRATKADVVMRVDDPPHRDWRTIERMVTEADLDDRVRTDVLRVFGSLAAAEGQAHGIPAADVHFHEVGALDSIADIVGVCAAVADLGVASVSGSEVSVGSGTVRMAHGRIAVPGPAVVELSRGWRIRSGGEGELTTPTGMALVTTLGAACEDLPPMSLEGSGTGAGTRDVAGRPNVTRVFLGQRDRASTAASDGTAATVIEANVDDLDPRLWPGVLASLIAAGAQDAWLVPILMKKGRPAHSLHVLCAPDAAPRLRDVVYAQTSTIGVREAPTTKFMLPRTWVDVQVDGRPVPVKISHVGGVITQVTPEFDAVAGLARTTGRTELAVMAAAVTSAAVAGLVPGAPVPA